MPRPGAAAPAHPVLPETGQIVTSKSMTTLRIHNERDHVQDDSRHQP
jgi:hypothetical protein